jgi:hypothetical protein
VLMKVWTKQIIICNGCSVYATNTIFTENWSASFTYHAAKSSYDLNIEIWFNSHSYNITGGRKLSLQSFTHLFMDNVFTTSPSHRLHKLCILLMLTIHWNRQLLPLTYNKHEVGEKKAV